MNRDNLQKGRATAVRAMIITALCLLPCLASAFQEAPEALLHRWVYSPAEGPGEERLFQLRTLRRFYQERDHLPAWSSEDQLSAQAVAFVVWLESLHLYGIDASRYHLSSLREATRNAESLSREQRVWADILWTDAWLQVARHLYYGRVDPSRIDPEWQSPRKDRDFAASLKWAFDSYSVISTLDDLHPPQAGYARLVEALAEYREIANDGGWPHIRSSRRLELGVRDAAVVGLRDRFRLTGELTGPLPFEHEFFDEPVRDAVIRFQTQHGLKADGIVGPKTLEALNVPVEAHIHTMVLNLERWRWLPQNLGSRYVMVNIAGFELTLVEDDEQVLQMDVIVGRPVRSTPEFSGTISYLVLNPTWTVPTKLAVEDQLPMLQKDPAHLQRENFMVLTPDKGKPVNPEKIDWTKLSEDNFPYVLRQRPGPRNALGRIKFMFPNRYSVYMHDTPAQSLFASSRRAFSSGCIRLAEPLKLADRLLSYSARTAATDLQPIFDSGRETNLPLQSPVPVHLTYWTAWANPDGVIQFRPDVYGRDAQLWSALEHITPEGY